MFGIEHLGLFIMTGLLLNMIPGPDTFYILARTVAQGRRAGTLSVLGISTGCLVHTIAAALGLSAILVNLRHGFHAGEALRRLLPRLSGFANAFSVFHERRFDGTSLEGSKRSGYLCPGGFNERPESKSGGFLPRLSASIRLERDAPNLPSILLSWPRVHRERNLVLYAPGPLCLSVVS